MQPIRAMELLMMVMRLWAGLDTLKQALAIVTHARIFAMALNGKEGTCFTVQARRHRVCAWNKDMEAKHWSKEGRQTFQLASNIM